MKPEASVVIVTYNSAEDIVDLLRSLQDRQGVAAVEVVIIDNGSTDGTPDVVRQRFPEALLIEQQNVGYGGGANRGTKEANADVLVFLNPDMTVEPGFLRAMVDAVAPSQVVGAQAVLKSDPSLINTLGHRLHFTGYGFVVGFLHPRLPPGEPIPVRGVSGVALAIRREDFLRIGGYDPDFFLYMEDTELNWRMHRAGFRMVVAPSAVGVHDYVPGLPSKKIRQLETGRMLILRKHLPWHLWVAYSPSLALGEALAWIRAVWMGLPGLKAKFGGLRSGLRGGIKRYPQLPRARPHEFASRRMPFGILSTWRSVALMGGLINLLFRLNTLSWRFRKRPPHLQEAMSLKTLR